MQILTYLITLLLIGIYAYFSNRIQRIEWKRVLLALFALPALTMLCIIIVGVFIAAFGSFMGLLDQEELDRLLKDPGMPSAGTPIAICVKEALEAGVVEELYKFAILSLVLWVRFPTADKSVKSSASRYTDCMLLSICVAESFGLLENLLYVRASSILIGHLGHAFYGLVMGYLFYKWRNRDKDVFSFGLLTATLVVPIFLHFLWDLGVFLLRATTEHRYSCFLLVILYVIVEWWIVVKFLRKHLHTMKSAVNVAAI